MNKILILLASSTVCLSSFGDQISDDFNDGVFNDSYWNTFLPYSVGWVYTTPATTARVIETAGGLYFVDGIILTTKDSFPTPTITGSITTTGRSPDWFRIGLRSDGEVREQRQAGGIGIEIARSNNPELVQGKNLRIVDFKQRTILAEASYFIAYDTFYEFKVVDNGQNISLYMGGSLEPVLSYDTLVRYGELVDISNREFIFHPHEFDNQLKWCGDLADNYMAGIDNLVIISPEPNACLFLLLGVLWMFVLRSAEKVSLLKLARKPIDSRITT